MPRDDEDLRALWQAQPPSGHRVSIDDVKKDQAKLARRVRFRNAREYAAAALVVGVFGVLAVQVPSVPIKVACLAIIGATIYVVRKMLRDATVLQPPAPDAPMAEHLAHHRASLVRQRDLLQTVWRWYLGPLGGAILLFYAAVAVMLLSAPAAASLGMILPRMTRPLGLTVALFLLIGWANRRAAKRLDHQIGALDA